MAIDFERGAKTAGSTLCFTTGDDALREWQLMPKEELDRRLNQPTGEPE